MSPTIWITCGLPYFSTLQFFDSVDVVLRNNNVDVLTDQPSQSRSSTSWTRPVCGGTSSR